MMFYKCDPRKATGCSKRTCFINGGDCGITSNPEYAENPNVPLTSENSARSFCRRNTEKYSADDMKEV